MPGADEKYAPWTKDKRVVLLRLWSSVYDFARFALGVATRGPDFLDLRERLVDILSVVTELPGQYPRVPARP